MGKRHYSLLFAFATLALSAAAFTFWRAPQGTPAVEYTPHPYTETGIKQEPITPIPLNLGLDARKVELGRRLFYDPRLSRGNTISCAHCHSIASNGAGRKPGALNAPSVFNSGFNFRQFWDGRAATLEDAVDSHFRNPAEMEASWPEVVSRLERDLAYRRSFAAIYPEDIEPRAVKDALAAFLRSLSTPNSKFDRYLRGEKSALDRDELAGYDLFKSYGCITCHQGVNVGGNMYGKLGLIDDYFMQRGNVREKDFGRYNLTGDESDRYVFRVPSLRNVAQAGPYFHDASVDTLEASVVIMAKYQLGVELRDDEVAKVVKFLKTLTGEYRGEAAR